MNSVLLAMYPAYSAPNFQRFSASSARAVGIEAAESTITRRTGASPREDLCGAFSSQERALKRIYHCWRSDGSIPCGRKGKAPYLFSAFRSAGFTKEASPLT